MLDWLRADLSKHGNTGKRSKPGEKRLSRLENLDERMELIKKSFWNVKIQTLPSTKKFWSTEGLNVQAHEHRSVMQVSTIPCLLQ